MKEVSLYFHVPFCTKKCGYCHFFVLPDKDEFKDVLLEGFRRELESWSDLLKTSSIVSVYLGGGTPSLLNPQQVAQILKSVDEITPLNQIQELTLEVNPENVDPGRIKGYLDAGINRISMGVQSFDQTMLNSLGRNHSVVRCLDAVETLVHSGVSNVSIDLMYDLPCQTLSSWKETLEIAGDLPIQHLSLYNLVIEPHTAFYKHRKKLEAQRPSEEVSLQMYEYARQILEGKGLVPYEISAFSKGGKQSLHNMGYWIGRPFLGFGPSAFSYWEGKRFRNVSNLHRYSQALKDNKRPIDFEENLTPIARRRELFCLGLRLFSGVDLSRFIERHGELDEDLMPILHSLETSGYLASTSSHIRLTKSGILFYDTVASEIVLVD